MLCVHVCVGVITLLQANDVACVYVYLYIYAAWHVRVCVGLCVCACVRVFG